MLHHLPRIADRALLLGMHLRGYRTRRVQTCVGRLHALEAPGGGALPPVVVLHGLSASGQYYESLMGRLRPHVRRVIAPDMPGHGYSERPPGGLTQASLARGLREGLDQLLEEPAILFGNSLGAAAAIRYARERPERVLGLVLAAPGGAPMDEEELRAFLDRFVLRDHADALAFVERLFHRPPRLRHLLAWGVRQQLAREGVGELLRSLRPEHLLAASDLEGLRMPLLALFGEADRLLPPSHQRFFEEHLPAHAELRRVEGFGHVPHMSHPDGLAARVLAFARRLEAGEAAPPLARPSP